MSPRLTAALAIAALAVATAGTASADQTYQVTGVDTYTISEQPATQIAYSGAQRLSVTHDTDGTHFTANARYTRTDDSGKATVHARFLQAMAPDGSFEDRADDDPDFLTVLNQPFAVQLDRTTLRDLRTLRSQVPFAASSPLGGATLRGFLRPSGKGRVNGRPAVGVRFEADGPMTGTLPEKTDAAIAGKIRMDGTAFYDAETALLLALDATLTIDGKLTSDRNQVPVHIVYRRAIKAQNPATYSEAKR